MKQNCLIIDIETSSFFPTGQEINISYQFEEYLQYAQVKWFGAYSYARNSLYLLHAQKDRGFIMQLLATHSTIIGFNSQEFDYVVLQNTGYTNREQRICHIDLMQILGKSTFTNRDGYAYKNRGVLMDYKFKNNSLKTMAEEMKLEHQKGEIDYKIFQKNVWTPEEEKEIKTYLTSDVMTAKAMFDKLWDYWVPFTEMLEVKYVKDFSWIRSTIASLTYKAACSYLGIEPTYSEKISAEESMGGNVLLPKYEEAKEVWYVDFASLYPHLFCMFNLFAEIENPTVKEGLWHGNDMFQVRGYYDIKSEHKLNTQVKQKLAERIRLKATDKKNPMIYAIKIFLNGLYGVARSQVFEKIHTENCGWDCCWLGQQVQAYTIKRMTDFGFEAIYGDTDSVMLLAKDKTNNNKTYVRECLKTVVKEINAKSPFPVETFDIAIEGCLDYIMFPFSSESVEGLDGIKIKGDDNKLLKEMKGKKKNYVYIKDGDAGKEVILVGLPIKKDNATALGIKIYNEVLEMLIIQNNSAKFAYNFMKETVNEYLKKDEILTLIAQEYRIKSFATYKKESQIQAQISLAYLNGQGGIIHLIKNKKTGKVGKGNKYCTIEEAKEAKLVEEDLDLVKLWNELTPFIDSKTLPEIIKPVKVKKEKIIKEKIIKIKEPKIKVKSEIKIKVKHEKI